MVMHKKDLKRRKSYAAYEIKRKILKAIIINQKLEDNTRWWAQIERSKLPKQSSLTRAHSFCIQTGRSRSVISFFKLSRLRLRKLARKGDLVDVRKSSW